MFADVVAISAGVATALWLLISVLRTVVLPRPERVWLTTVLTNVARTIARSLARRLDDPIRQHRVLGAFAPALLVVLPLIWSFGLWGAFAAIYWGLDVGSVAEAIELSGSSLTTLGFVGAPNLTIRIVAIIEALVGLSMVALVISFLPTLYGTFSRREIAVGRLTTRAGEPPSSVEFLIRLHAIGRLREIGARWSAWEDWFVELGETHTTFPALVYFRSAYPGRSWLDAAEVALDTAAISHCVLSVPDTGEADTMIRSGYLAMRAIADFYRIEPEGAGGELSVSRGEFDAMCRQLTDAGLEMETDQDAAWERFCGWRVNYDRAIVGLRDLIEGGPSHWDDTRIPPRVGG